MITIPQKNRLAKFLYGRQFASEEELTEAINMLSPEQYYIGLSSTVIDENGAITNELSGNGYSRIAVSNTSSTFSEVNNGSVYNKTAVTWDPATAEWQVRCVFVACSQETTEAAYVFNFDSAITVPSTATLYFDGQQLELSVSSN